MSLTGKNTISLRKKDVLEQKQAGAAYKRLVFAHKATLGDTGINITSLTQPSEMASLGFTNPSTAEILAGKMLFHKKNLTVVSSSKGVLIQDLSYTVPTNERIAFQDFTAEDGEIFTCILESSVRDGLQVVDAISITSDGELAIGDTDYNVGTPFEVGKNISFQVGAVLVFRDGVLQKRNTANGTSGGNYQEIDAGGGLGSIIRFNDAPVSEASDIVVVSNGMVAERPTGSVMAVVETLAGQVDAMIPTLADLAGVDETDFQAAPNNVDLKNFGDNVNAILNAEIPIITEWSAGEAISVSATTTPPTKGTVDHDRVSWRQVGEFAEIKWEYRQTGAGSAGSGDYLLNLPAGLQMDTSKIRASTATNELLSDFTASAVDSSGQWANGTQGFLAVAKAHNATQLMVTTGVAFTTYDPWSSAFHSFALAGLGFSLTVRVPIVGFQATQTLREQLGL